MRGETKNTDEQIRAEAEIRRFRNELGPFVTAAESTRMPMVFTNAMAPANPIIFANESFVRLTGYSSAELLGQSLHFLLTAEADCRQIDRVREQFDSDTHDDLEEMFRHKDGSNFCAAVFTSPVLDIDGNIVQHFVSLVNLTKYKQAEEALRLSEGRFRMAASAARLGVADIDLVSHEEHWSSELREMLGVAGDAPVRMETYTELIHPDDRGIAGEVHARAMRGEPVQGDEGIYRIVRPNGGAVRWIASERQALRNDNGKIVRILITNRDITAEKAAQDRITWVATHDAVTGLPNRIFFRTELETALAGNDIVSLLLIDLDRFKQINDLLGHQAGDEALSSFARRVAGAMPPDATLARLGGDEFAAILPGVDLGEATAVAKDLQRRLEPSFSVSGRDIDLRASVGISLHPAHGKGASQLVHSADLALYSAKKAGGARVRAFVPTLRAERQGQLSMLRHARAALDNHWIEPFYQPQVMLATGITTGFEALLRWRHPRAGLQLPHTIAYAFDDVYSASLLGAAMAESVLSDVRRWLDDGLAVGKVAINASAAEFRDPAYAQRLLARLERHGIPAALLELEITETAFLDDHTNSVVAMLNTLRKAGVTVALDDFGTGFSSLSHLRDFPVDTIKIDRSFVAGIDNGPRDRAIIEAVLLLGSALGMTTVAEGVETQAQADFLAANNCMLAQGFLFAPAIEAAQVEKTIRRDASADRQQAR